MYLTDLDVYVLLYIVQLTQCSRFFLERLNSHSARQIPKIHYCIMRGHKWFQSQARCTQSTPSYPISQRSTFILFPIYT